MSEVRPLNQNDCICRPTFTNPHCPQSVVHNGRIYHASPLTAEHVYRATPDVTTDESDGGGLMSKYNTETDNVLTPQPLQTRHTMEPAQSPCKLRAITQGSESEGDGELVRRFSEVSTTQQMGRQYMNAADAAGNRENSMQKFKPLVVNGQVFTDTTIGGYRLDQEAALDKIKSAIKRPPIALPLVFSDKMLNVYHHLIHGLECVLGREVLIGISAAKYYSARDEEPIVEKLIEFMESKCDDAEEEMVEFAHQALNNTFDVVVVTRRKGSLPSLLVVANIYGFEYIEGGMRMRDPEVRMWISTMYASYRALWFSAFKSSGIPHFAIEGVQDRYEEDTKRPDTMSRPGRTHPQEDTGTALRDPTAYKKHKKTSRDNYGEGRAKHRASSREPKSRNFW